MNPQVVSVPQLPVPSLWTSTLRQSFGETVGILSCHLQDLCPRFIQNPPDAHRHQVDGIWCAVWPPRDVCSGGQQWTIRRVRLQEESLRRNAGQSLFLLLVELSHYSAHTKMSVREHAQPEPHILRFSVKVMELNLTIKPQILPQDPTEIIPSTPLGSVVLSTVYHHGYSIERPFHLP